MVWFCLDEYRMAYSRITVDGKRCYQFPNNTQTWPRKMDVNCTGGVVNGSVVRLEKDVTGLDLPMYAESISICEFQIWSKYVDFVRSCCQ